MQDSFNREKEIFERALEMVSAEARQSHLADACAGDPLLLARVEALLKAHEAGENFLPEHPRKTVRLDIPAENLGDRIGRYKLLQRIGEGGCGVVYLAEQEEPVRRRVALKVIKLGMDTKAVIARFEAERQALAMMDHPNIAKVLDAGATETGRPYFVMELVRGIRITDYCDRNKLATDERLKLFVSVCQAIQHAHQKGIIHRDIKPSNILVTLHDGVPVPKVIDFGIAKATQGRLTDQTLFTAFEQFIGTPTYMSPEQAEMSGLDIDTRTDIYSLGVLLYELLTGRTPFDSKELLEAGLDALRRTIREKEPPRPSTRLSTMEAEALISAAAQRHTDAPKLIHLVRGDLDWIAMKALEKDRTRRYETANGLAMDVQRYLKDEPIVARPPSTVYRLQKSMRRNKLMFAAATMTALALIAGVMVSTWQAVRAGRAEFKARQERDAATRARQHAETISRFLTEDLLYQATPDKSAREKAITMEEVLDRAASHLDQNPEIAGQPDVEATLRMAFGSTYTRLGNLIEAKKHLNRAVTLWRREPGSWSRQTLLAQKELAEILTAMNQFDGETEQFARETAEGLRKLARTETGGRLDTNLYRASLDAEAQYIYVLAHRGQLEKAIELKRENVAAYERFFGADDKDSINELNNLAYLLTKRGDYAEAEQAMRKVLAYHSRKGRTDSFDAITGAGNLALYRLYQSDAVEAEALLREAYPRSVRTQGAETPTTLMVQHRLARALEQQGRLEEAQTLAAEALAARRRVLSTNDGNTAYTMLVLGRILVKRGKSEEAKPLLEESRKMFREHYEFQPDLAAQPENWLGAIQLQAQNLAEAERLLVPGEKLFSVPMSEMSPAERGDCVRHLAQFYQAMNQPEKAALWQRRFDELGKGTALKGPEK